MTVEEEIRKHAKTLLELIPNGTEMSFDEFKKLFPQIKYVPLDVVLGVSAKTEAQQNREFAIWLGKHRRPIQPYTEKEKAEGYTKDDWFMRESARQTQIDELLKELGFTKFDVIPLPETKKENP